METKQFKIEPTFEASVIKEDNYDQNSSHIHFKKLNENEISSTLPQVHSDKINELSKPI